MLTITMSSKGQIVIPSALRQEMGLGRDTRFRVERREEVIVLIPIPEQGWRCLYGLLAHEPNLLERREQQREQDRAREHRKLKTLTRGETHDR